MEQFDTEMEDRVWQRVHGEKPPQLEQSLQTLAAAELSEAAACLIREVIQSCPTLSDPMDCSPPGSSAHGILQARTLEWVAISFSNA